MLKLNLKIILIRHNKKGCSMKDSLMFFYESQLKATMCSFKT